MKVGITFLSFETLNNNYEIILKEAKNQCDYLIIGLQLDTSVKRPEKKTQSKSIIENYIHLKDSIYVDEVVPYVTELDIEDILRSFEINVLIIRKENKTLDFTAKEYCIKKGIEIYYSSGDIIFQVKN